MSTIRSDYVWIDGEFVPFDEAKTHVLAHSLHYGMGAFEGIRAYAQPDGGPGVWCLDEHLQRLLDTVKILRLEIRWDKEVLRQVCGETLRRNGFDEAYIRPLVWIGAGAMGLGARTNPVHTAVMAWKWGAYLGDEGLISGVKLCTSTFTRHHPNAAMQRAKVVGHYVNSILARYEANEGGFDEALMLDANGYVAEGTGENVFVVYGKEVLTPPGVNILPGITRASVIEILEDLGYRVKEQFFARDAFWTCDEAFMVGTAAEVTPIASLDRRQVGPGRRGPVTEQVQRIYLDAVRGKEPRYAHHITRL